MKVLVLSAVLNIFQQIHEVSSLLRSVVSTDFSPLHDSRGGFNCHSNKTVRYFILRISEI